MNPSPSKRSKMLTATLFAIYLIALSWIVLFKMQLDFAPLANMNLRNINLVPFAQSAVLNGKVNLSEIVLNIAAFIPFGVYMSMLRGKWGFFQKLAPIFGLSLVYEVVQYALAIGASDITDLIGNTLGGAMGIALFFLLRLLLKGRTTKVVNILATIATAAALLLMGALTVVNM